MLDLIVAEKKFCIGRLEYWWIAFNNPKFFPQKRKHIKGCWFWKLKNK